jgi:hypothetical protein
MLCRWKMRLRTRDWGNEIYINQKFERCKAGRGFCYGQSPFPKSDFPKRCCACRLEGELSKGWVGMERRPVEKNIGSSLFWGFKRHWVVDGYWRFGTAYLLCLQASSSPRRMPAAGTFIIGALNEVCLACSLNGHTIKLEGTYGL